ncbi:hypothetical protein MPH55_27120, partial [Klebsiella pneumoniae]|nr:hypothetical protein [Klebsiella pneumoniae]
RYPDIRLELISESRFVDIIAQRFDAGVRLGPEVGSGMIAVRINASQHAIDKVLLPKLAVFKQRYPDIRLELISESRFVDI